VGNEWALKCFGNNRQIVVSTHEDSDYFHNHFAVAPYSLGGKIWYDNQTSLARVRKISDEICIAYDLSIIKDPKGKGDYGTIIKDKNIDTTIYGNNKTERVSKSVSYFEWDKIKEGNSWKEKIRNTIDELINGNKINSVKDLIAELINSGYEINREGYSKGKGFYFTVKVPDINKSVRNYSLGEDYTYDNIQFRINNAKNIKAESPDASEFKGIQIQYAECLRNIIAAVNCDIAYFKKKFTVVDIREASEVIKYMTENNICQQEDFNIRISELSELCETLSRVLDNNNAEIQKLENELVLNKLSRNSVVVVREDLELYRGKATTAKMKLDETKAEKDVAVYAADKYNDHIVIYNYPAILAEIESEEKKRRQKNNKDEVPDKELNIELSEKLTANDITELIKTSEAKLLEKDGNDDDTR
jgi:hypothetical protein